MKLACQIGIMPEQFWRLTHKEFKSAIEGYMANQEMDNRRTARICAAIANANRDPKKRKKPFSEDDFIPKKKEKKEQTPNEMLQVVRGIIKAFEKR